MSRKKTKPDPNAPQIIEGMPFEEYVALPYEHASLLKDILVSPFLYKHRREAPKPDTDTLRAGRIAHAALFEPDTVPLRYAVWPSKNEEGKKQIRSGGKWEAFVAANPGRTILTEEQYHTALRLRDAVRRHPEAKRILEQKGRGELTVIWTHARTGIRIKCRFDWLCAELMDFKSTFDIAEAKFGGTCHRFGYDFSLALYHDAAVAAGVGPLPVSLVSVEKNEPHDVAVDDVPDYVLARGRRLYERALDRLVECERTGHWPGQAPTRRVLKFPEWALREGEEAPPAEIEESTEPYPWEEAEAS